MIELNTRAEKRASTSVDLPAFGKVSLSGIKSQIAEMLNLIGRSNEIFATYTKHDISHINAMLGYLEWLIPPATQEAMTRVDWLLVTLAIYFHDLGMLVTAEEFDKRHENEPFGQFVKRLNSDPKGRDYLSRAKKMTADEQERFFFQEFIRENHATRVKEWITGRHSRHWGSTTKPITEEIAKLLEPFPSRFRENLATVCESHHRDNLNRLDIYPLCQGYGNHAEEIANVQYAALMLRTVDLIHVTKDRTPSISYKTIKFSDPKSVDEWDKQKDTFAVRQSGRTFVPEDKASHYILISADFTEERPFFALAEYIAWADSEIRQTKRWSDQTQTEKDAKNFWFPWHTIKGDLRVEGNEPQQMRFEFDRGRLLDLLVGHAIYNDATVAVRELLQNAIDAVRFQHHIDNKEAERLGRAGPTIGKVRVVWHPESRKLTIHDEGTGMDLDIIKFHLMRVGSSFYDTPQFASENRGFTPISRFGIGVLTCFMISDDIEIVTFKNGRGHRIRMTSVHADYLLRDLLPGSPELDGLEPHGTRFVLTIRDGEKLTAIDIEKILRYWVVLPACGVEYTESGKSTVQIGFRTAEEALKSFYNEARRNNKLFGVEPEIISKRRIMNDGQYEIAIAVEHGWLPEKTFAPLRGGPHPAVCIEGINVSNVIPGWSHDQGAGENLGILVSVRGVRGLRTTVSRSNLEQDEEYSRVGKICIELMFEHIADEVVRISSDKGKPLSRASTAAKWLCHDLAPMTVGPARRHLDQLREALRCIVIESSEGKKTSRTLVTPKDLHKMDHFWTLESRLVDSLGIISRDLGRELSLVEFLNALAPEFTELQFSPIVPDAHLFSGDIIQYHYPVVVEFSRRYQQTAIKWQPGGEVNKWRSGAFKTAGKPFQHGVRAELAHLLQDEEVDLRFLMGSQSAIGIAKLSGDEVDVQCVVTRLALVLAEGSDLANVWSSIQNGLQMASAGNDVGKFASLIALDSLLYLIIQNEGSRDENYTEYHGQTPFSPTATWKRVVRLAEASLREMGITTTLPKSTDFIRPECVFNASWYWRDWHRTNK